MKEEDSAIGDLFKISLSIIIGLVLLSQYAAHVQDRDGRIEHQNSINQIPVADPNRKVDSWDYQRNTFIYEDEVPEREPWIDTYNEPYPDMHVKIIGNTPTTQESLISKGTRVTIDGKTYAVRKRINGDIEFDLID